MALRRIAWPLVLAFLVSCNPAPAPPPPTLLPKPATLISPAAITSSPIRSLSVQTSPEPAESGEYLISGSVEWEDGRCCAGGTAGETIQVQAGFSANNPQGEIEETRVRTGGKCFTETELAQSAWEPFVLEKSYPFTLPINWVGFYITVQYRDLRGNLSPVYCDDISLEGIPPRNP